MPKNNLAFKKLDRTDADVEKMRDRFIVLDGFETRPAGTVSIGGIGKAKLHELIGTFAKHQRLVIGALPKSLLTKPGRAALDEWCEPFGFSQMVEGLQGNPVDLSRVALISLKAGRLPKSSPLSQFEKPPTILYLHDAGQALEGDCNFKETLFKRLEDRFKDQHHNLIVLFDIDADNPKFLELIEHSQHAVVYYTGLNSDTDLIAKIGQIDNSQLTADAFDDGHSTHMIDLAQLTAAEELDLVKETELGPFNDLEEVATFEKRILELQADVRSLSLATIELHQNLAPDELKGKLADKQYRQARFANFVGRAQKVIRIKGIGKHQIAAAAATTFQETWNAIAKGAEDGCDPDVIDRISMLKKMPSLPLEAPETFDKKSKEDIVAFVSRVYGKWIDPRYGLIDVKKLNELDTGLGSSVSARLRFLKQRCLKNSGRLDHSSMPFEFPPAWLARENREMLEHGKLSDESRRLKINRERHHSINR